MESALRFIGMIVVATAAIALYRGCKKSPLDTIMNRR